MSVPSVDKLSQQGFGKGNSELYDAVRPRYDPQVFAHIRTLVPKEKGINVVEIGSGSGIFTRSILSHPDWADSLTALHAIDPNEGMRSVFASTVDDPRVKLSDGVFEKTGVEDGWADVIVMAASFHWCLDYEAAIKEFSRILSPEGVVVLVTYEWFKDPIPYQQQLKALIQSYNPRTPTTSRQGLTREHWHDVVDSPSYSTLFEAPHEITIASTTSSTTDKIVKFILTASFIAVMDEGGKAEVAEKAKGILENGKGVKWVDKPGGALEMVTSQTVVSMRKKRVNE